MGDQGQGLVGTQAAIIQALAAGMELVVKHSEWTRWTTTWSLSFSCISTMQNQLN